MQTLSESPKAWDWAWHNTLIRPSSQGRTAKPPFWKNCRILIPSTCLICYKRSFDHTQEWWGILLLLDNAIKFFFPIYLFYFPLVLFNSITSGFSCFFNFLLLFFSTYIWWHYISYIASWPAFLMFSPCIHVSLLCSTYSLSTICLNPEYKCARWRVILFVFEVDTSIEPMAIWRLRSPCLKALVPPQNNNVSTCPPSQLIEINQENNLRTTPLLILLKMLLSTTMSFISSPSPNTTHQLREAQNR